MSVRQDRLLTKGLLKGRLVLPINIFIFLMHLSHEKNQYNSGGFTLTFSDLDFRLVNRLETSFFVCFFFIVKATFRLAGPCGNQGFGILRAVPLWLLII